MNRLARVNLVLLILCILAGIAQLCRGLAAEDEAFALVDCFRHEGRYYTMETYR